MKVMQTYFNWRSEERQGDEVCDDAVFFATHDMSEADKALIVRLVGANADGYADKETSNDNDQGSDYQMIYSLAEAADLVGKSKMTLNRAIKQGKLSATKNEKGAYEIDGSELHRVYEKDISKNSAKATKAKKGKSGVETSSTPDLDVVQTSAEVESLKKQLRLTQEQLDMKDELIDQVKSERDRVYALITDQSQESKNKEERLNKQIEALRERVKMINEKRHDTVKAVREAQKKAREYSMRASDFEKRYTEESQKPWYKKLFG